MSASLSVTQGKGLTLDAAKVSGLMEAIEHYHAETLTGTTCIASERELGMECVSGARLSGRLPRFSANRRIQWLLGERVGSGRATWIPFDLVHLDLRVDGPGSFPCFVPNSNGLASGNCRDEAVVHALSELIERHATAEFYDLPVSEQERRRLVLGSVLDADCRNLIEKLQRNQLAVTLWDLTSVLEVPCFLCELLGENESFRPIPAARGFGCHVESGVALARAICEAAQSRVTAIAGSRDDLFPANELALRLSERATRQQWALRAAVPPQRLFRAIPTRDFADFRAERDWLLGTLARHGFEEPASIDLSKPGWPCAVVRVVAPGLRFEAAASDGGRP